MTIITAEVKKGDSTFILKDSTVIPAWAGWRRQFKSFGVLLESMVVPQKFTGGSNVKRFSFFIFVSFFCIILLAISIAVSSLHAGSMTIAVASSDRTATAPVSNLAGRSPYYLLFDLSGKLIEVIENPYMNARGGAGQSVVTFLAQKDVTVIVAGEFGSRMVAAMKANGIDHFEFRGTVSEAVKNVLGHK
jgi:predicted Fe-Mo cluster-binding NifX family protein